MLPFVLSLTTSRRSVAHPKHFTCPLRANYYPITCSLQTPGDPPAATAPSASASLRVDQFDMTQFESFIYQSQEQMCSQLEQLDKHANFCLDDWSHNNGKGRTRVLQGGAVFEKAGINVTVVRGTLSKERAKAMSQRGRKDVEEGKQYEAAALSLVLHTQSPFIPTLRGDIRVFKVGSSVWGGGGTDLTMYYVDRKAFSMFHKTWRDILLSNNVEQYDEMKRRCDEYFFLPSRQEHRGVGGIFYDDLEAAQLPSQLSLFSFQALVLDNMLPVFLQHVLIPNIDRQYNDSQKKWQRIRRGRYLEFNLLNDRGVKFGLASAPAWRTDSIMISAPPSIEFPYNYTPPSSSPEGQAVELLSSPPIDWAAL